MAHPPFYPHLVPSSNLGFLFYPPPSPYWALSLQLLSSLWRWSLPQRVCFKFPPSFAQWLYSFVKSPQLTSYIPCPQNNGNINQIGEVVGYVWWGSGSHVRVLLPDLQLVFPAPFLLTPNISAIKIKLLLFSLFQLLHSSQSWSLALPAPETLQTSYHIVFKNSSSQMVLQRFYQTFKEDINFHKLSQRWKKEYFLTGNSSITL